MIIGPGHERQGAADVMEDKMDRFERGQKNLERREHYEIDYYGKRCSRCVEYQFNYCNEFKTKRHPANTCIGDKFKRKI